ncbi:MAG: ATP-binding cassette domain-containing protein [Sphingomonadales bacterium]|nr:MAG: ATP-binding cassette domain-containing protein [Sphingomonadales bacterium]
MRSRKRAEPIATRLPDLQEGNSPLIAFEGITRNYGDVVAVNGVSLEIAQGSFVALVGASGSGKSTLLKMVNTLVEPSAGKVLFGGEDVSILPPSRLRRRIGYVFQGIGLFPHMSVAENIAIGPRLGGEKLEAGRIAELLELVELEHAMANRMPDELSGGQRQRIGVARALANDPELLLMDEPFGALDPITRDALGERVRALHTELGLTTVMVTHDMAEALLLADRVLVMDGGRIVADETPASLLAGRGGDIAQGLVAVPRAQAEKLAHMEEGGAAR